MFPKRNTICAFAFGVGSTLVLFLALGADKPDAQQTSPLPRYQISSWSFAQRDEQTGQSHGAYRIDTQTGKVTAIIGDHMVNVRDAQ
jgi:hypothetical protein